MDEFQIGDFDWRNEANDDMIMLSNGVTASEKDIYFAVEKLTPLLQRTQNRHPNEEDITAFLNMLQGPN